MGYTPLPGGDAWISFERDDTSWFGPPPENPVYNIGVRASHYLLAELPPGRYWLHRTIINGKTWIFVPKGLAEFEVRAGTITYIGEYDGPHFSGLNFDAARRAVARHPGIVGDVQFGPVGTWLNGHPLRVMGKPDAEVPPTEHAP